MAKFYSGCGTATGNASNEAGSHANVAPAPASWRSAVMLAARVSFADGGPPFARRARCDGNRL